MDILNWTELPIKDESIEKYEWHSYKPITGATFNGVSDEIVSTINAEDIFIHPSESYLVFKGSLRKAGGAGAYDNADNIALMNNGIMYLFSNIKYELSGQLLETLNHPGQATTMLGLLKYPDDFSKSQGLNQLRYKDGGEDADDGTNFGFKVRRDYLISRPTPKGTFSFTVPLRRIFGFCKDYTKITYGMKHALTLVRKSNNDAIFRSAGVDAGEVILDEILWYMPHVMPADQEKFQLYKTIESKISFPVLFRGIQCDTTSVNRATSFTWRLTIKASPDVPRFIIVGFQTANGGSQQENPAIFDHANVSNIYVTLNSRKYPEADYNISFTRHKFSRAYFDAAAFRSKFYGMDELISNPNITPDDYKLLIPLFVFDVRKQRERLKYAVTDIHVVTTFSKAVEASTHAFAVVRV